MRLVEEVLPELRVLVVSAFLSVREAHVELAEGMAGDPTVEGAADRLRLVTQRAYAQGALMSVLRAYRAVFGEPWPLCCSEPSCRDFGDPDFGELTCPSEHATAGGF